MKAKIILFAMILSFSLSNLFSQSIPDKITIGAYTGSSTAHNDDTTYLRYVRELNLNTAIHVLNENNKEYLTNLDIITYNNEDEFEYIYHYTQGYNSKWVINSGTIITSTEVGFKQTDGISYSNRWTNGGNTSAKLFGPRYKQEQTYRKNSYLYNEDLIYFVKIRIRTVQPIETTTDIFKVEFNYYTSSSSYVPLRGPEILTTEKIGTDWTVIDLDYSYTAVNPKTYLPNNNMLTNNFGQGLEIVISALPPGVTFEIDLIEFLDEYVWRDGYLDNSSSDTNLEDYIAQTKFDSVQYFYGQDEPNLREQAIPYNTVQSAISGHASYKPLFTTFYPQWNEKYCGEFQFPIIHNTFESEQMMFYYYPVINEKWQYSNYNSSNYGEAYKLLSFARNLLNRSKEVFGNENLWYGLQVHAYRNDNNPSYKPLRNPTVNEIRVQALMALAHGMKGIFFYNVPSDESTSGPTSYNIGLIETDLTRNYKYYFLRDDLIPRIRDYWESHLIELDYNNVYDQYIYDSALNDWEDFNNTGNVDCFELVNLSTKHHLLVTQLDNVVASSKNIYYAVINLVTSPVYHPTSIQPINISYEIPTLFNGYRNIRFRDLEDSFDKTFDNNSSLAYSIIDTLYPGDCIFIQTGPVVKNGGNLVYDDTVITAITLSEPMTIKPNAGLTIEAVYTIDSDIYVEDGGMIETNLHGGIVLTNGAEMEFEDWSDGLVISQYDDHPKLYWTEHQTQEESVKYEIYRKKDSPSFQLIHTITDKAITEFTDTDVDILYNPHANETTAQYYVITLVSPSKTWFETDRTITVLIDPVQGEGQSKKSAGGIFIEEYSLQQNHPNPFNPTTVINYQLPEQSHVTIKVFDILGKEIAELVNTIKEAGFYSVNFDASNLSSGNYIYRIEAGKFVESKKMIVLK